VQDTSKRFRLSVHHHIRQQHFSDCSTAGGDKKVDLAVNVFGLVEKLTAEEFHPENYEDEYRIRVLSMLDKKSKGKEVTISAPAPNVAARSSTSWKL
jgi:non-homologous end joining protein Ku